jgi:hypothetical protein
MQQNEQLYPLTNGFHRDCGPVVVPIHRNAVNTGRHMFPKRDLYRTYI